VTCNGGDAQKWKFVPTDLDEVEESGRYKLISAASGLCVAWAGVENGTNIQQADCHDEANNAAQVWEAVPADG
jgi:Ricin-type beta-trefoil lectin domain-like